MANISEYEKKLLKDRLKTQWTYTSNAIEGNTISLGDTAFIIENGLTIQGKSIKEHNEVIGHAKAIDIIYDMINKDKILESDLFLLHKAVQSNIVIDIFAPIGEYKNEPNARYVEINGNLEYKLYPSPKSIPHLMKLWFSQFEKIEYIYDFEKCVDVYTNMHISFTAIHPFFDGNGRMGRLVSNIPLLKSGLLPIIIDNTKRQEYIKLLSSYNISAKELDQNSTELIEKNQEYYNLREFFKTQYQNSQKILDEITSKRGSRV
jgi:Fic family protein